MPPDASDDSRRSVRVEIGDASVDAPLPGRPESTKGPTNPLVALGLVALGGVLIGFLLYSLSPDAGESVGDEPATTTVEPATSSTLQETTPVVVENTPTTLAKPQPYEGFETVWNSFQFWRIERSASGWVALAPPGTNPGVMHSPDGLNWELVDIDIADDASVVGLDTQDDGFVLAVVPQESSNQIWFFESSNGQQWSRSSRYPEIVTDGFAGSVSIAKSGIAVSSVDTVADPSFEVLQQFLSPVIGPETAELVCSATIEAESIANFRDCTGGIVASIEREAEPLFFSLDLDECLGLIRSLAFFDNRVSLYGNDGELVVSAVTDLLIFGNGWFDGETYLAISSSFIWEQCQSEGLPERPDSVFRVDSEGSEIIDLRRTIGFQNSVLSLSPIAQAGNGDAVLLSRGDTQFDAVLLRSSDPYREWGESTLPVDSGFALRTLAADASVVMTADQAQWLFIDVETGETLRQVDIVARGESASEATLLLATDDYAVVRVRLQLVRVPLNEDEAN